MGISKKEQDEIAIAHTMDKFQQNHPASPMNMSIFFYRVGCRERIEKMSFEKKKSIAQQISEYSLREPIWDVHEKKYTLKEFPEQKFTGLQIFAYIEEIMSQFGGDVNPDRTKMVKLFVKDTKK